MTAAVQVTRPRLVVLGSLNMDLLVRVPRAPQAGETLTGHTFATLPGGKGGNQAVSCARQGAQVSMVGRVGADAYGAALREALVRDGIAHHAVKSDAGPTGVALVMVDDSAQNRIVVIPGANGRLEIDAAQLRQELQGAAFLVTQLEAPLPAVLQAVAVARAANCRVLFNPSPVAPLPDTLWPDIDTLVLNEVEAAALTGSQVDSRAAALAAGLALRGRGVQRVVVTLGAQGAVAVDGDGGRFHPALAVTAIDTTAAGDTFTGALAVGLARGERFDAAVRRGIRAAAWCVTRLGAQPSIPDAAALDTLPWPDDWIAL
ncbi:ribokinase [Aquabacterium sp. A7-Y]|uniref:ribokinase n=1 Tax=Aquabacterium sp. A7-Y TaxID=1349605 RepID=UPI00223D9DC1|nr:ribokinase [Aquabacterium sp. A7-Y]MCW7538779.1 ribokinase [Aquabacterium sp. A7-Y]